MNCDPLTVSVGLHTAFIIKYNFSKKWTWLMQKYRITPKQGIYTRRQTGDWGKKTKKPNSQSGEKGAALSPPRVKQPTLVLVTERMSSFFLSNVETKAFLQQE